MTAPAEAIGPFVVEGWLHTKATGIGYHVETLERVSIKTERASSDLSAEACTLQALSGCVGMPTLYWFGTAYGQKTMITELAGETLETIFDQSGRYFDMQILLEFAHQLVLRVEWMHSRHISHGNLSPSCFMVGLSSWQAPQITLTAFGNAGQSQLSAREDLNAVGDILLYFATQSVSWDKFKATSRDDLDVPPILKSYFAAISSGVINPADYATLRRNFYTARQSLSKRTLFGGLGSHQQGCLSLKQLNDKTTGNLFEDLAMKLSAVGQVSGSTKSSWTQKQAVSIVGSLDEIMAIFMVLLLRDRPSRTRQRYVMGAYHLPNRLWRDLRWYLCMASCGSISFQRLITLRIYKFMGVLLEVMPFYKHWTKYLSELAHAQMALDLDASCSWRQAWIYWKSYANFLD